MAPDADKLRQRKAQQAINTAEDSATQLKVGTLKGLSSTEVVIVLSCGFLLLIFGGLDGTLRTTNEAMLESDATVNKTITATTTTSTAASSSCHFEDGNGYYERINETLTWNWIHNSSRTTRSANDPSSSSCIHQDYLEAIMSGKYSPSKPLAFLVFGDSLDRNTWRSICDNRIWYSQLGFDSHKPRTKTPSLTLAEQALINTAESAEHASGICSSKTKKPISFAFMKIYGMHHSCSNSGFLKKEDRRRYNTKAERVDRLLDFDILSRLPNNNETNFVVMAGSSLWDLSEGTGCNNQIEVSERYKILYTQGIVDLHATIRKHMPEAPIYWRTSPAITAQYNRKNKHKRLGRTRANQQALNNILKETVSTHNSGIVVDWWSQASHRPENDRGHKDGRHYQPIPSLVFYNMFLNAVFDHHPLLLK